jgi:putative mRNA 3-end processing factor
MIIDDFIAFNANGLYCRYADFYLDPQQPVNNAVISHAHADHAVSGNVNVYTTEATYAFMKLRYGKGASKVSYTADYSTPFSIGDVEITFIPAGHMPGSAQVLMEYKGVRYLYTGDYKLQPDATCEPMEFAKTDVLITESTFADPTTAHPDRLRRSKN